ncbi:MAG: indole-3-glycerol phosphate synthase TrpC [Actinomycetota bacterium]|nr:indole-3-glycerol phosphate synthase TrpC [Actinomycetota bacterium]MDH5314223.1 indole-3-glycerol phosphate synthase TrpC [Actinomycetota bacterium]
MGFLTDVVVQVRRDLAEQPLDEEALLARARARPPAREFTAALRGGAPALIAEVKRASPSIGEIAADADVIALASAYAAGGAAAVSVLTEPRHFHGSLADLDAVRLSVQIPLLRKDFLVHPAQVIEARAHGADAVLLIAGSLSDDELAAMLALTRDLGMGALVETHAPEDLDRAISTGAEVIGVNARDLESLEVDARRALEQLSRVPGDRVAVFESGVRTRADVETAVRAGASAVLVGEALMRARDPRAAVGHLLGRDGQTPNASEHEPRGDVA